MLTLDFRMYSLCQRLTHHTKVTIYECVYIKKQLRRTSLINLYIQSPSSWILRSMLTKYIECTKCENQYRMPRKRKYDFAQVLTSTNKTITITQRNRTIDVCQQLRLFSNLIKELNRKKQASYNTFCRIPCYSISAWNQTKGTSDPDRHQRANILVKIYKCNGWTIG